MSQAKTAPREQWAGRTAFVIAAISSAIGLGNIWRFPGVAYENGGGAFLLPYFVAFLTAGLPILFLDYAIGHRFKGSAPLAFRRMSRRLEPLGWWQVMLCYLIALYYSVVIAWALAYVVFGMNLAWGDNASDFFFGDFLQASDPGFSLNFVTAVLLPLLIVWVLATFVLSRGIRKGLHVANRFTLPVLVVLFTVLVAYSLTLDGAIDGLNAFFTPSWEALGDPTVWIAAYGHIFFSFSIAFGVMITYASYVRRKTDLAGSGTVVAFANCSFEVLAGIGVFATLGFLAVQQSTTVGEIEGISGVALAFVTFPTLLSQMPAGAVMAVLFFVCLVLAGFTSLLSLLQVIVGALKDKTGWSTPRAGLTVGLATGIPSVLLFSTTTGVQVLDVLDAFVNNIGVVGSAIAMLLVVGLGTRIAPTLARHVSAVSSLRIGKFWTILVTVVTPIILIMVLLTGALYYVTEGYGGGDFPGWFQGVAGWGALGIGLLAAFLLSLGRYRGASDDDFTPDDVEELEQAVRAERERIGSTTGEGGSQR